ncbi:Speckle-type POZ protein [Hordeum vulgare]|nr:Speckle-type POZ protein [Hordeum vulgare]
MQIDTESKGKEVVPAKEQDKGKDVVSPSWVTPVQNPGTDDNQREKPSSGKRQNYDHYHEVRGPTNFYKAIMTPQLETIPMPSNFTKHFRVTLDQGSATFVVVHQIKIGFMMTFKLLTPYMLKVIVFNDDGIEVVTRCGSTTMPSS